MKIIFYVVVLSVLFEYVLVLASTLSIPNLPVEELNALKSVFDSTNGNYWNWKLINNYGAHWNFTVSPYYPCQDGWQGLECKCGAVSCNIISIALKRYNMWGCLPASIGNFSKIQLLDLSENRLFKRLPVIKPFSKLTYLKLDLNQFTGVLPDWLYNSVKLDYLDISNNYFNGSIANDISNLVNLTQFRAVINGFSGSIPEGLGSMPHLRTLALSENQLIGSLPDALVGMHNLSYLALDRNYLTGSLPDWIGQLSSLFYLQLSRNLFTQSVPTAFVNLTQLTFIALDVNMLTGSISSDLTSVWTNTHELYLSVNSFTGLIPTINSDNLFYYELEGNQFSQTIPSELFALHQMNLFDVSDNHITGTMPDVFQHINEIGYIDVHGNLLSGTIPSTVTQLLLLVDLLLYENLLSGTLPVGMNKMNILEYVMLQDNRLEGTLDNLINASAPLRYDYKKTNLSNHQILASIDVSANSFTGPIPPQIFTLPRLTTFAAVSNCLSGYLPNTICNATSLTSLALDGLSTAATCHSRVFPGSKKYTAYVLKFALEGGLPTCVYALPELTSLHLSGNGISGSIPGDVAIGDKLVDLSLSHNHITGTIPLSIQQRIWSNLDLSYNKFDGLLDSTFAYCGNETTITMNVNRLSGYLPANITYARVINILQGNLFSCPMTSKKSIPRADENYDIYDCGSNSFFLSGYIWLGVFLTLVAVIGIVAAKYFKSLTWFPEWSIILYLSLLVGQCFDWMSVYDINPFEDFGQSHLNNSLFSFGAFCNDMRYKTLSVTLFLLFLALPAYAILTLSYESFTYSYAWMASAMYLSGVPAAVSLLLIGTLWICLAIYVGNSIIHAKYTRAKNAQIASVKKETRWQSTKRKLGYLVGLSPAVIANCFAMILVNFGYVYTTLHYSAFVVSVAQFFLAAFKLAWNEFAVRKLLSISVYYLGTSADAARVREIGDALDDTANFIREIKEDIPFRTIILLFNNIATPCIAVAIISPVCFSDLFFTPPSVQTSYQLCLDALNTHENRCSLSTMTTFSTTYPPPYTYSYQCSSTFIENYASMYVYMFLIVAFVMPISYITAKLIYTGTSKSDSIWGKNMFFLCDLVLPPLLKPLPERIHKLTDKYKKRDRKQRAADRKNEHERAKLRTSSSMSDISEPSLWTLDSKAHSVPKGVELLPAPVNSDGNRLSVGKNVDDNSNATDPVQVVNPIISPAEQQDQVMTTRPTAVSTINRETQQSDATRASTASTMSDNHGGSFLSISSHKDCDRDRDNNTPRKTRITSIRELSGRFKSFVRGSTNKTKNGKASSKAIFFSKGRFILRIITEVATLLTFGAVFPPLAVTICVSVTSYTLFTQLLIGRFLTIARKHRDYGEIRRILESECYGVSTQLIESFVYLIVFAALFYSMFLFDTLGDVYGAVRSIWIVLLMIAMPAVLLMAIKCVEWLQKIYEGFGVNGKRETVSEHDTSMSGVVRVTSLNDGNL